MRLWPYFRKIDLSQITENERKKVLLDNNQISAIIKYKDDDRYILGRLSYNRDDSEFNLQIEEKTGTHHSLHDKKIKLAEIEELFIAR